MSAKLRPAIAVCSAFTLGLCATACDQPAPKCAVQRGAYAAKYTFVSMVSGSGDCGALTGELLNVTAYGVPTSKSDPQPDPARTVIGVQPQTVTDLLGSAAGAMVSGNPEDNGVSLGEFAKAEPGKDDFCVAPALSTTRVRLPTIPESTEMCVTTPEQPPVDVTYDFKNIRVYTTAAAYGTQFAADLTYTKDGCSALYRVDAVYPAVDCTKAQETTDSPATGDDAGASTDAFVPQGMDASADIDSSVSDEDAGDVSDADGGCAPPMDEEPAPDPVPDDSLCLPYADVAAHRATGSGINPDFAVHCDPGLLLCVLSKEPPSKR
jgi:hypothetical protein